MRYKVLIKQDKDGIFIAECPTLPGCISQGKTRKEVIKNIRDAIKGYLTSLRKHKEPIPSNEDILDIVTARQHANEPRKSLKSVKKWLQRKGKLRV